MIRNSLLQVGGGANIILLRESDTADYVNVRHTMPLQSVFAFATLKLRRTRFAPTASAWLRHA